MPTIDQIIKTTELALNILGTAQSGKTPKQIIDFASIANSLIGQIDALIQAIGAGQIKTENDRVSAIKQAENAVYTFQRLPQQKNWKSKDNAAFKNLETSVISKLNELRNTSTSSNGLNTNVQSVKPSIIDEINGLNTNTLIADNSTLIYVGIGIAAILILTRRK